MQMKRGLAVPLVALTLAAFSCLAEEELPQRLFRERWQERPSGRFYASREGDGLGRGTEPLRLKS